MEAGGLKGKKMLSDYLLLGKVPLVDVLPLNADEADPLARLVMYERFLNRISAVDGLQVTAKALGDLIATHLEQMPFTEVEHEAGKQG